MVTSFFISKNRIVGEILLPRRPIAGNHGLVQAPEFAGPIRAVMAALSPRADNEIWNRRKRIRRMARNFIFEYQNYRFKDAAFFLDP